MKYTETDIPGVWIMEPKVFADARGYFMESFKKSDFEAHVGRVDFIQENESYSTKGVLRGLHYQLAPYAQAKLVRVIQGEVLDVAVDIRVGSPTFGKHVAVVLSGDNKKQFFIPQGFAHGFKVLSETALFQYKVDNPYRPDQEGGILFSDPAIGIDWGLVEEEVILSEKDRLLPLLREAKLNINY
ncbi:dTDP-4-dehydrorhamnose 3,5-epimerase [Parabacteroides sp. PFB2-12]|uniref:dTDP-4-dehydrorhamnose 3,5-epimerase n=1 Tax=unclassified Parabacteroides TaxID=2649774 RepID=UPI002475DD0C|nr:MULTISPECIES: dTDP-4-dehydrorhamnose 3,5-epimerase [unclassified Parabacteroides]MDH6344135.1 dTDP-4-dehydrorhamnose 3,5-epimerase [Parabacteroides sp. PM6-13]MDH6392040.1 dTDP-4-dehydrorhamnose 3,5-epimerase [Parabacteroides sp. PFB2-12]